VIVKVQLSISSTLPGRRVLIYDESRKHTWEDTAPPDIEALMGDRLKAYFHAHLDDARKIIIDEAAPPQDW
jgi:hypothetical protein